MFHIRNSTQRGVQIDWNTVTIIGDCGLAIPVIHRGVRMGDRSAILAPSTVPPGAILEDFVYPREGIAFMPGTRYTPGRWRGTAFFERMKPGQRFTLYLPIKHGTEPTEYQFTFEIGPPE